MKQKRQEKRLRISGIFGRTATTNGGVLAGRVIEEKIESLNEMFSVVGGFCVVNLLVTGHFYFQGVSFSFVDVLTNAILLIVACRHGRATESLFFRLLALGDRDLMRAFEECGTFDEEKGVLEVYLYIDKKELVVTSVKPPFYRVWYPLSKFVDFGPVIRLIFMEGESNEEQQGRPGREGQKAAGEQAVN